MTQGKRTVAQHRAALTAKLASAEVSAAISFGGRGFSSRTIETLIARGIDAPERLLFASETTLKRIRDIGEASFEEIVRYRTRFIRKW